MASIKTDSTLDLRDILAIVWKRKWFLIIPVVIATAIAYVGAQLLPEKYTSSTIIWIDKPASISRELQSIVGSEASNRRVTSSQLRQELQSLRNELTSQSYLSQLIEDLNLDDDPDIAREAAKMRQDRPNFSLDQLKNSLLMEDLRDQIGVAFAGQDQIMISVESEDPVRARDMVAQLAKILEERKTREEIQRILDNQNFADEQLERLEADYKEAVDSLTAAQARLVRLQLPENISSEANRRSINSDIDQAELDISDYRNELSSLQTRLGEYNLTSPRLRFSDSMVELRTEIDSLISTFAQMAERYVWNEQAVVNVNIRMSNNIALLEEEIETAVADQYASYPENERDLIARYFVVQENIDILNSRRRQLVSTARRIEDRINEIPRLRAEVQELQLKVDDARRYRDAFSTEGRTVEFLTERTRDRIKYKIIEAAHVPLVPSWPDKNKIAAMGLLLGFVLGGGTILLVELLDTSFRRIDDVEDVLGLPVLATIPKIENLKIKR